VRVHPARRLRDAARWATIYYVLPNVKQAVRSILPGAVAGVLVWLAATMGFSVSTPCSGITPTPLPGTCPERIRAVRHRGSVHRAEDAADEQVDARANCEIAAPVAVVLDQRHAAADSETARPP